MYLDCQEFDMKISHDFLQNVDNYLS